VPFLIEHLYSVYCVFIIINLVFFLNDYDFKMDDHLYDNALTYVFGIMFVFVFIAATKLMTFSSLNFILNVIFLIDQFFS
jgi:hypothetical protein